MQFVLARHFGFCYGVENAIEISYRAIEENPGKKVYLLSQMIHNQEVNNDLESRGIKFIMDTDGSQFIPWDNISRDDVVIIPAFGTTLEIENLLLDKGVEVQKYNTTCPFVEKVWNRAEKLGKENYTIIIHGKPKHEETKATFSHSNHYGPSVIVRDMGEAQQLANYLLGSKTIALVLLNIRTPATDGIGICTAIRQSSEVPILSFTDLDRLDDAANALIVGADGYITCPFTLATLKIRLRGLLNHGF